MKLNLHFCETILPKRVNLILVKALNNIDRELDHNIKYIKDKVLSPQSNDFPLVTPIFNA